jgi:hypothetical protein
MKQVIMAVNKSQIVLSTKSIIGAINELTSLLKFTQTTSDLTRTTQNYKYSVYPDLTTTNIQLNTFGIGTMGSYNIDDENLSQPYAPHSTELSLYRPLPFRCVPYDEDLTATERQDYRMRTVYTKTSGDKYWCYYQKKIQFTNNSIQVMRIDPDTKLETPYEFTLESLMNPQPNKPATSGYTSGMIEEVRVYAKVALVITGQEIHEAVNVMFDGDLRQARISEIGLFCGEDRQVTGYSSNNTPFAYTETIQSTLLTKSCFLPIPFETEQAYHTRDLVISSSNIMLLDTV